jgi:thiol-disulfide isomerase/thioredoxin
MGIVGLAFLLGATACAHHANTVISVEELTCASCIAPLAENLGKNTDIKDVQFNKITVEVHIRYDAEKISPEEIFSLAKEGSDLKLVMGPGKGSYPSAPTYEPEIDAQIIVKAGEVVDIEQHLAAGKITIIDFSAEWCGPCRALGAHIHSLLKENPALALRRIEIVDWDSPIAQKYLGKANDLPYILVYDKKGALVGTISGFKPDALEDLLEHASK